MCKRISLLLLIFNLITFSQTIEIKEVIATNSIVNFEDQKLILIDFWATWCGPCVPATQQLEFFQEANKKEIFVLSISDEPTEKIKQFLIKKPVKLMVVNDSDNFTFSKFNITSRPYAVLLNNKGDLLWRGHPSDLKQSDVKKWAKENSYLEPILFEQFATTKKENSSSEKRINEIEITQIENNSDSFYLLEDNRVAFNGLLSDLLVKLHSISSLQLKLNSFEDKTVSFNCTKEIWDSNKKKIIDNLQSKFNFMIKISSQEMMVHELIVKKKSLLWDINQIDWGSEFSNYFIGNERIQADNFSIKELAVVLSEIKKEIYIYNEKNMNLYDWDFHYVFDDLMLTELESSFGIGLEIKLKTIPVYEVISKKKE